MNEYIDNIKVLIGADSNANTLKPNSLKACLDINSVINVVKELNSKEPHI